MIELLLFKQVKCRYNLTAKQIKKITEGSKYNKKISGKIEVNIVGIKEIKKLNKKYRAIARPTDVLAFAWHEDRTVKSDYIGQIYICAAQAKKQAIKQNVSETEEITRLLIHGILHLIGYDHQTKKQAQMMFNLQEKFLKQVC